MGCILKNVLTGFLPAIVLCGCIDTIEFNPRLPDSVRFQVYHNGTYSSKIGENEEVPGTLFLTNLSMILEKKGDEWHLTRTLDSIDPRGYHKNSLPGELEKKADLNMTLDPRMVPKTISGFDSLPALLGRIEQKDAWKKELLARTDTTFLKAEIRDRWRLAHVLPKGTLRIKTLIPLDSVNPALETLKADSIVFHGRRSRSQRSCLEYTVYYGRQDSLVLLTDQFLGASHRNSNYRQGQWTKPVITGQWQFSVDQKTGLSCFEARSEIGEIAVTDKDDKSVTSLQLIRYEEDVFTY